MEKGNKYTCYIQYSQFLIMSPYMATLQIYFKP